MTGPTPDTKLSPFLSILANAALLLGNPLLGFSGTGQIVALIQYASAIIQNVQLGADELRAVDDQIKVLVAEQRPPTEEEWATWEARLADVDARFAKIKEDLDTPMS
jgi:hypothetical protein